MVRTCTRTPTIPDLLSICAENRDQLLPPSHYLDQMANQTCEVWVLDQAYDDDKQRENGGGMLYIYDSAKLKSNRGQGKISRYASLALERASHTSRLYIADEWHKHRAATTFSF